jgi:hypothetical protein
MSDGNVFTIQNDESLVSELARKIFKQKFIYDDISGWGYSTSQIVSIKMKRRVRMP